MAGGGGGNSRVNNHFGQMKRGWQDVQVLEVCWYMYELDFGLKCKHVFLLLGTDLIDLSV